MNEEGIEKKQKERIFFHMDGDAFFVGVEIAKNPKLKGLPVVTGEERGIVSALSYEAKALGITRGMPVFRLKKEFPNVIILAGDYKSYAEYSSRMFEIVRRYADDVEEYSIDECFADLTGLDSTLYMSYLQIAQRIKKEVNSELGLSVSVGLAPTKVLAKVASKWVKPDGLTEIRKENAPNFLSKTPIEKIWGLGLQTSTFLKIKKVFTALDFINKDLSWVKRNLSAPYETIWYELRGIRIMSINPELKIIYSSIQKTRSFHPSTNEKNFLFSELSKHIEDACRKARHYHLVPKKISFFLKTTNFKFITFSQKILIPANSPEDYISLAYVWLKNLEKTKTLYRTTGVTLHDLAYDTFTQADLFGHGEKIDKLKIIHKQIDKLENKLGKRFVHLGSSHKSLSREMLGTEPDEIDRNLLFL